MDEVYISEKDKYKFYDFKDTYSNLKDNIKHVLGKKFAVINTNINNIEITTYYKKSLFRSFIYCLVKSDKINDEYYDIVIKHLNELIKSISPIIYQRIGLSIITYTYNLTNYKEGIDNDVLIQKLVNDSVTSDIKSFMNIFLDESNNGVYILNYKGEDVLMDRLLHFTGKILKIKFFKPYI